MVNWEEELRLILNEKIDEPVSRDLSFESDRLIGAASHLDLDRFQDQLKTLDKIEREMISGRVLKRQKELENKILRIDTQTKLIRKQFEAQGTLALKKKMYDEFKNMREMINSLDLGLCNKIDNVSKRLSQRAHELQLEHNESILNETKYSQGTLLNQIANLESGLKKVDKRIHNLKDHVDYSLTDLAFRHSEHKEETKKEIHRHAAYVDSHRQTGASLQEVHSLKERLEGVINIQKKMESHLLHMDRRFEEESRNNYNLFEKQVSEELCKVREDEKHDLDRVEMEEIRIVDEKLHEVHNKLNRIGDIVIHYGKQVHEMKQIFESRIHEIENVIGQIKRSGPIIVE